jgi:methylated-DNA-[protein]-cysteine S-methyltransferase
LTIIEEDGKLVRILFPTDEVADIGESGNSDTLDQTAAQLQEYFAGTRKVFDIPLAFSYGTDFQKAVWEALCGIPYAKTSSYGDIAAQVGRPKASRAVGGANHNNPMPIIIPCHRVIGSTGSLVGYGGGLAAKQWLLAHERQFA